MATPSPVASTGLVVTANSWPAPPVASSTCAARTRRDSPRSSTADDAAAASVLDEQVERRSDARSTAAAVLRTASTSARSISAPVAAPPAWTTRATEWPPSRASASAPSSSRSNIGPEGDQLVDPARPLVDEHPDGVDVAQAGAGRQRVGEVEVGRVGIGAAEHGGDAALRPPWSSPGRARPW